MRSCSARYRAFETSVGGAPAEGEGCYKRGSAAWKARSALEEKQDWEGLVALDAGDTAKVLCTLNRAAVAGGEKWWLRSATARTLRSLAAFKFDQCKSICRRPRSNEKPATAENEKPQR